MNAWVRVWLYVTALATGGAFCTLFTGNVYGEFAGRNVWASAGGAFWTMILAALVALFVGSSGRYRFVLLLPAAALYALLAVYGWPPVTPEGWRRLAFEVGSDAYAAAGIMYVQPVPYDLHPGILLILIPVVMVVVAFAASATLFEGSPIISVAVLGLTIGMLSTVSFEDGAGPFFALFLIGAVALLLVTGAAGQSGDLGGAGAWAGAVVVIVVLLLPQVAQGAVRQGIIDWTRIGTGGTSRLAVQADVGDYLTAGRDAELMRVRSPEPLLWRGGTLDFFDGVRWSDTTRPGEDYGEEIDGDVETRTVLQSVEILNAQTDIVFGGYKIVETDMFAAREGSDGSWSLPDTLAEGSTYRVLSEIPQPTSTQLENAGTDYPEVVREKFLQLPPNTPETIGQTAQRIQRRYDPQTSYAKARAIERYLLYDGGFVYNLDADFRRADQAIENFLGGDKEGFCTQFASSMALIAREMGVPSRLVYGSTSGQEVEPGEYVVTGSNMHTWVELYFPGVGWYPFDPTPGFSMPTAMEANAPRPRVPVPQEGLSPQSPGLLPRPQVQRPSRDLPDTADQENAPGGRDRAPVWPAYVIVAFALVLAVPLTKRALLARGRPEDLYRDLTGRLRDVTRPGAAALADSPALTPTERIMLLSWAAGVEERSFREFAEAYSDYLYSAAPESAARATSESYAGAVRELEALPRWRLLLGAVNPASLVARARQVLTSVQKRLRKALRRVR